jgi:hypothetical protein
MPAAHDLQVARVHIARAERRAKQTGDTGPVQEARRDYAAAAIEAYVVERLRSAPPLTQEQRDRIASLLRPTAVAG